jgi:hypothetical protein
MSVEDKITAIFGSMTGEEEFDALSNSEKWERVKDTWLEATNHGVVFNDVKTIKNTSIPKSTKSMKERRIESCFGKDGIDKCAFCELDKRNSYHYCNVCNCGGRHIARLDGKGYSNLDFPGLKCPLRKLGFANELV